MKLPRLIFGVMSLLGLGLTFSLPAYASPAPDLATPAGLAFAEISITGSAEFVVIQNNTSSQIDLSTYWLYDYNNYDSSIAGTTTSTQQLPDAKLSAGETLLLSKNGQNTCGAAVADSLGLSLVDSHGLLELFNSTGSTIASTPTDSVSWSSGTNGQIKSVASASPQPVYYRYQSSISPAGYSWQKAIFDSSDACQLEIDSSGTSNVSQPSLVKASSSPPAKVISLASSSSSSGGLPASDNGLKPPVVNELLPNPAPPAKDADGEFIELYNPNSSNFDLQNFIVETGLTTKHKYTFPSGVYLKTHSFTAYKLIGTGLSLSNSGGQVQLLDPYGTVVSKSDPYGTAKDGQAWALANGIWYWTNTPTPSAENTVNQSAGSSGSAQAGNAPQVLGASTTAGSGSSGGSGSSASGQSTTPPSSIHPWTLAAVAALALGYGAYEYRQDLANRLHQLRRYRAARAAAGPKPAGRRDAGAASRLGRWQDHIRARFGHWTKK